MPQTSFREIVQGYLSNGEYGKIAAFVDLTSLQAKLDLHPYSQDLEVIFRNGNGDKSASFVLKRAVVARILGV